MFKLLSNNSVVPSNLKENMVIRNNHHFFYALLKMREFCFLKSPIYKKNDDSEDIKALIRFNIS